MSSRRVVGGQSVPFLGRVRCSCDYSCVRATLTIVTVPRQIKSMLNRRSVLIRYNRHDEANDIQRDVYFLRTEALIADGLSLPAPFTPRQRHALAALLSIGETGGDRDLGEDRAQLP